MKTSSRFHIIAATASLLLASGTGARAQTVNVWLTTDDQSSKLQPQTPVAFSTSFDGGNRLFIDENQTYQQIEGRWPACSAASAAASGSASCAIPWAPPTWRVGIIPTTTWPPGRRILA